MRNLMVAGAFLLALATGGGIMSALLTMRDDQVVKTFAFIDSVEFNELGTRVTPAIARAERGGPKARLSLSWLTALAWLRAFEPWRS
jgi:hypothetical protein